MTKQSEIEAARAAGEFWTDCYDENGDEIIIVNRHRLGDEFLNGLSDEECEVMDVQLYEAGQQYRAGIYDSVDDAIEDIVEGLSEGEIRRSGKSREEIKTALKRYCNSPYAANSLYGE